jgi:hypothetical protein
VKRATFLRMQVGELRLELYDADVFRKMFRVEPALRLLARREAQQPPQSQQARYTVEERTVMGRDTPEDRTGKVGLHSEDRPEDHHVEGLGSCSAPRPSLTSSPRRSVE